MNIINSCHLLQVRKLLLNSVLLSSAALEGLYEEVECYLRQPNVTPNVLGLRHKSPLQLASIAGHHQVVGLLLGREVCVCVCVCVCVLCVCVCVCVCACTHMCSA